MMLLIQASYLEEFLASIGIIKGGERHFIHRLEHSESRGVHRRGRLLPVGQHVVAGEPAGAQVTLAALGGSAQLK